MSSALHGTRYGVSSRLYSWFNSRLAARLHRGGLTRRIFSAMGIFGGVQLSGMLCSIVRAKLVALWIGAVGVGLFGLFNTALDTIAGLCQLSISQSAVRDLAAAPQGAIPRIVALVRRWNKGLGLLGALACLIGAPWLSQLTFGDEEHTVGFMVLAVAVFIRNLSTGESAIFQGLGRLKPLARANFWGVLGGLLVSIPMFWFWRIDSIVPSILAYVVCTGLTAWIYHVRVDDPKEPLSLRATLHEGRHFVTLGIYLTVSAFVGNLVAYVFMTWLNRVGGTAEVGYYNAGFTLLNRYIGLVFTVIGVEYFPRLASVISSPRRSQLFVAHETRLLMWIVLPILVVFIAFSHLIVALLYDSSFLAVLPFIVWAAVGIPLQGASWTMAFTMVCRGDGKIYLFTETLSGIAGVALNIIFYSLMGLTGLGIAFTLWYAIYLLQVWLVYRFRYHMRLPRSVFLLVLIVTLIVLAAALLWHFLQ